MQKIARMLLHHHDTFGSSNWNGFADGEFETYDYTIDSQSTVPLSDLEELEQTLSQQ